MAKKKNENTLSYLQMPLPSGKKYSKMTKVSFGGLNKRYTLDSGYLSMENNISTNDYPYLVPSERHKQAFTQSYPGAVSMSAFDDFLIVVYFKDASIWIDYIKTDTNKVYTGFLKRQEGTFEEDVPRSIVQFNVYDTPTDPLTGKFVKKLLIFPDQKSMFAKIEEARKDPDDWDNDDYASASRDVLYKYKGSYFTVEIDDDGNYFMKSRGTVTSNTQGYFIPDSMDVDVKTYYNDTPEVDASGAIIYPPPDTASHNCYYLNTYKHLDTNFGTDIYKWCEYDTVKREDEWGLEKDDNGDLATDKDGNYIKYGFVKDETGNYINDGTTHGWKVTMLPAMPNLKYATVHLSRVFGVDDDRVYASGYNDYTNWNLDTIDEYNEANSWCSPSQANTKAGGTFTGITTFQGHVICFKRDFMHEIYNTKNPFRLQDIYAEGTIDNRTIQDVDGKLIFVSEDDVKVYTGSNPRIIGYNLNMTQYEYAVSGTDNRNYYLYCEDTKRNKYLYVYDTYTELWSEQSIESKVLSFAHNKNGMYMLCADGYIYQLDTGDYQHEWSFETELITSQTVNIKHVKKLQMLVDIPEHINGNDNLAEDGTDANMRVYILYDNESFDDMSATKKAKRLVYTSKRYGRQPIRVKPRKTANYGFKLHIEGEGYIKLYELEIFIEAGGEMYV